MRFRSLLIGILLLIPWWHRCRHIYVNGATGTGKSNQLLDMFRQDAKRAYSIIWIDPSGMEARNALGLVPIGRKVIYCSLQSPTAINPLIMLYRDGVITENFIEILDQTVGKLSNQPLSVAMRDILRRFTVEEIHKKHPSIKNLLQRILEYYKDRKGEDVATAYRIVHRLSELLNDPEFNQIVCGQNSVNIEQLIDSGDILIIDCHQMTTGQMILLGNIITKSITTYFMQSKKKKYPPVVMYMDEFQNFINQNFIRLMREGRKYNISVVLSHQDHATVWRSPMFKELLHSILSNVGTMLCFRVGAHEAQVLSRSITTVTATQLANLPQYHVAVRTVNINKEIVEQIVPTLKVPRPRKVELKIIKPFRLEWRWHEKIRRSV